MNRQPYIARNTGRIIYICIGVKDSIPYLARDSHVITIIYYYSFARFNLYWLSIQMKNRYMSSCHTTIATSTTDFYRTF